MQGVVAEAVQLVQLPLVHTLFPVNVEDALGNGCHLIDLIAVEGDDAQANEIGNIVDGLVLRTFQLQFAYQRLLRLYAMLDGRDVDALFTISIA